MDDPAAAFRRHLHPGVEEISCREGLWVLHKPPRVLSHPNPPARRAPNALLRAPYDLADETYTAPGEAPRRRAFLLHRLDAETSGIILLALEPTLAAEIKELFFRREVRKEYQALVRGIVPAGRGTWRDELVKARDRGRLRVTVRRGSRRPNAETCFRVLERFPAAGATLLALEPETGRTHQLRVQAAARGFPIAGDERYGDFAWNRELRAAIGLRRMFLHAGRLELRHPRTGKRRVFAAAPPPALGEPLDRLRAARGRPGRRPGPRAGRG